MAIVNMALRLAMRCLVFRTTSHSGRIRRARQHSPAVRTSDHPKAFTTARRTMLHSFLLLLVLFQPRSVQVIRRPTLIPTPATLVSLLQAMPQTTQPALNTRTPYHRSFTTCFIPITMSRAIRMVKRKAKVMPRRRRTRLCLIPTKVVHIFLLVFFGMARQSLPGSKRVNARCTIGVVILFKWVERMMKFGRRKGFSSYCSICFHLVQWAVSEVFVGFSLGR